jgi:L-malate glycosyltransferase
VGQKKKIIFVVVGRLGKNLIVSKIIPIIKLGYFDRILVFSEEKGFNIEPAEYICLPGIISNLKIRFLNKILRIIFEPLQLVYYALKYRPAYINGVFTNPKGINSWIAAKISGSRCIISIIGGQPEIETSFKNKKISLSLNIFMLKRCFSVFTKGENDNRYLLHKGIDGGKLFIFNGAIDTGRFNYIDDSRDIDLIYVGYFDENKGPDRFIQLCAKILSQYNKINALMIGNGPLLADMIKTVADLELTNEIKLVGKIDDVERYLKRSKLFVLPSISEGLSTAMLEAMACGCVPIVSNVGNNNQAAHHAHNAFLVNDYNDINSYFTHVIKLLTDSSLWKELSENARDTIIERYSPDAQAKILLNVFNI